MTLADSSQSIPAICAELGGLKSSALYLYLHADDCLKTDGVDLLKAAGREQVERERG